MVDMIVRRICAKMEFADGSSKAGYKHRLLPLLDEFTSLGKLPIMEKALAYIAGYGGKVYIIVQDITQLTACTARKTRSWPTAMCGLPTRRTPLKRPKPFPT